MKNPNELRAEKGKALDAARAIRDKAKAEARDLTEAEDQEIDGLLAKAEALETEAKGIEAVEKKAAERDRRMQALADSGATARNAGGLEVSPNADIRVVKDRQIDEDPQCGFRDYGEFAHMVKLASRPGGRIDDRLLKIGAAYGQSGLSGEDGGFLNPPGFSNRIYERAMETVPILGQCDKIVLSGAGNSITINGQVDHNRNSTTYRYGGVIVYRVDQGDQITRSSLKFRQITLKLTKQAALSYCTEEEMSDAFVNFGERLLNKHAQGIADELLEDVMFGTGVGKPLGAFASDACISTAKETGQAADTIVFENVIKMVADLWPASLGRANWYYNGEALPQLATMSLAVGTGGVPVFLPGNGAAGATPNTLWGRGAYATEHCPALGDAGDICLGDYSQYLLATKGSVQTAISIHLRFDYDEAAFRSTFRNDGRPAWEQSLRPRKGATAKRVSPFVKLAERA